MRFAVAVLPLVVGCYATKVMRVQRRGRALAVVGLCLPHPAVGRRARQWVICSEDSLPR